MTSWPLWPPPLGAGPCLFITHITGMPANYLFCCCYPEFLVPIQRSYSGPMTEYWLPSRLLPWLHQDSSNFTPNHHTPDGTSYQELLTNSLARDPPSSLQLVQANCLTVNTPAEIWRAKVQYKTVLSGGQLALSGSQRTQQ